MKLISVTTIVIIATAEAEMNATQIVTVPQITFAMQVTLASVFGEHF